ncbi:RNA helicase [Lithospermum erythrorhizon]|uniref:RNA helicase n=1 Tax=Lithospermum erythrorhizon TaxID=34254 RepID=A0AAV3QIS2_LITER
METAEASAASLGPRFAPDDPTLPHPWKGLIDGASGVLYYWNPETNVTQYEKPMSAAPPLPPGPRPADSSPKLAGVSGDRVTPQTDAQSQQNQHPMQQGQHMNFLLQQQNQFMSQAQHHGLQGTPTGQQHGSQGGQSMQPQWHSRPQLMQQPGQQISTQFGQPGVQPVQQNPQPVLQQMPVQGGHQTQLYPGGPTGQPQGSQYPYNQSHYMAYQQHVPPQAQQKPQQPVQYGMQGQQGQQFAAKAGHRTGFSPRDETDYQQANQIGFVSTHPQQIGHPSTQNLPAGTNSNQSQPIAAQSAQPVPSTLSSGSILQREAFPLVPQDIHNLDHQPHGTRFPNNVAPGTMQGQLSNGPPVGAKFGYEGSARQRHGSEYGFSSKDGTMASPQQPTLAAIPMRKNLQDMSVGNVPLQNVNPTPTMNFNSSAARPPLPNMYGHAAGPPFPNDAMIRQPTTMMGHADGLHQSAADAYRQSHEVTATGDNVPIPFMSFEATGFPPELLRELHPAGFSSPTPIQAQTWPIAIQKRDIVAIAKTGSGKTLGSLRNNPRNGPSVLVLAPTRELATQIQDEAIKFGRSSRVSCTCLYGGAPKGPQLKDLERGVDIVVATPGRLNDILEMKRIDFRQVSLLVLDEADRMLDMGFEPQIRKIVNEIPPRRQTLMYTATWPKEVKKIAGDLLVDPVQVNIGRVDELAANKSITQYVEFVPQMEKQRRLEQILRSEERGSKIIIFCSTKKLCDHLSRGIGRNFGAAAIHGDKSQPERDFVLNQFRSGKCPILVATDVAARGLDVRDIRVVINYDFPTGVEDYVHRIGRTGRAGATGVAYTFISEQDWKYAPDLVKVMEGANQHVPPELREMALRGGPNFTRDRGDFSRFNSANSGAGSGRFDSGGPGGFGGRGGMRNEGFAPRGGFGGRGGMREGGFGGRGGIGEIDGDFRGRGMRDGSFGGRGGREGAYGRPAGGRGGFDRNERGPVDRYNNMDGRGRGRGPGRFGRSDMPEKSRGRSYSRSPYRGRGRSGSRSLSRSRSRSRGGRSYSRSRSRSRSWSRSPSPRRNRSYSRSRSRSRSSSYDRYERRAPRKSGFDQMALPESTVVPPDPALQPPAGTQPITPSLPVGASSAQPETVSGSNEPAQS